MKRNSGEFHINGNPKKQPHVLAKRSYVRVLAKRGYGAGPAYLAKRGGLFLCRLTSPEVGKRSTVAKAFVGLAVKESETNSGEFHINGNPKEQPRVLAKRGYGAGREVWMIQSLDGNDEARS